MTAGLSLILAQKFVNPGLNVGTRLVRLPKFTVLDIFQIYPFQIAKFLLYYQQSVLNAHDVFELIFSKLSGV